MLKVHHSRWIQALDPNYLIRYLKRMLLVIEEVMSPLTCVLEAPLYLALVLSLLDTLITLLTYVQWPKPSISLIITLSNHGKLEACTLVHFR